jgi:hypothetical protein
VVFLLNSPRVKVVIGVSRRLVNGTNVGPIKQGGSLNLIFSGVCHIYGPVVLYH